MNENLSSKELLTLLNEAQGFVGKSRCSLGHSVSAVLDNAKSGRCSYCKHQFELYERLGQAFRRLADEPRACEASDDGLHECKECDLKWGASGHEITLESITQYAWRLRLVPAGEKVSAQMIPVLLSQLQTARQVLIAPLADGDGPGEEDGPWAEGWNERSAQPPKGSTP